MPGVPRMDDIQRFFSNLITEILNRFRYSAVDAADRKAREILESQNKQRDDRKS